MSTGAPVDVAVGVLLRDDGRFLLASRPEGKPYANYWEFPGGKLEPGETVAAALARELHEELGIDIGPVLPWVTREFVYPHAHVRLHFCRVNAWAGTPHAREGQMLRFCTLDDLPPGPLLPATVPVMQWLALPDVYGVSDAASRGVPEFLRELQRQLDGGLRLVQLREPALAQAEFEPLAAAMLGSIRGAGGRLLVNSRHPRNWAERAGGIHLTSSDLMASTRRPPLALVAASTHDADQLRHAAAIGVDFVVMGPVLATTSHPGAPGIGWPTFAQLISMAAVPVYAIGGLNRADVARAQRAGAHGIAAQRAIWQ